jgi:hypothetical protein
MAGKSKTLRVVACCLTWIAITTTAPAQEVHGRSSDLHIDFRVLGGANWCRPDVEVRLSATSADAYKTADTIPFVQMLGRIRAVILSQCETAETIVFEGRAEKQIAFAAEMSRLTKWRRIINLEHKSRKPLCPVDSSETQCKDQIELYLTARAALKGEAFRDVEIVRALESDADDLTFRIDKVVGKIRIARGDTVVSFPKAAKFADAIGADIAASCEKERGAVEVIKAADFGVEISRRGSICRAANQSSTTTVLVWTKGDTFRVLSLWSGEANSAVQKSLTDAIVASIRRH